MNLDKLTYAGNLENLSVSRRTRGYRFVHGDICDAALVNEPGGRRRSRTRSSISPPNPMSTAASFRPAPVFETNLRGTFTLLEAARLLKDAALPACFDRRSLRQHRRPHEADENYPLRASSPYSASKAGSDLLALSYFTTYKLPVTGDARVQ